MENTLLIIRNYLFTWGPLKSLIKKKMNIILIFCTEA